MKKKNIFLISIFLLLLTKTVFAADWWDKSWKYRRKISFQRAGQRFSTSEGGRAFVNIQNRAFRDAHDVRIVDENGNLLKHQLIWYDENDLVELICEIGKKEFAYVYWGNKNAESIEKSKVYNPDFGLYLETWEKPEGNFNNWEQVQSLFEKSKKIYGKTAHLKVHDRFNRFGPSNNYLSHYYGWLDCPENGKYKFYTASDDASFLLIDNTMVVQWAGRHTAWGGIHGQHFGMIILKKGKHRFDYYHVESTADQACVAGWRLPSKFNEELSEGETLLIPPRYFGGFVEGYAGSLEILGEEITVDCKHVAVSDLYMTESDALVKVQFTADVFGEQKLGKNVKYLWDFGDGNEGIGKKLSHVFLTGGIYKVEISVLQDDKVVVSGGLNLKVLPIWDQNSRFNENSARYFWTQIKDHKLEKINKSGLRNFYAVCDMIDNEKGKLKSLRELVKYIADFEDSEKQLIYLELAELEAYIGKDIKKCTEMLGRAQKLSVSDEQKISMKLKTAEILFKGFEKSKEALEILQALEKENETLTLFQKKEMNLLLGDLNRLSGNLDKARENYKAVCKTNSAGETADKTLFADWRMRINSYIRTGHSSHAVSLVQDWRWRNPLSYLDGDLAYLEVCALLADGQVTKAEIQAKILIKGQTANIYVGDCLWVLGEYFIKYKMYDKAKTYLAVLVEKYKEHPKSKDALEKIKTFK